MGDASYESRRLEMYNSNLSEVRFRSFIEVSKHYFNWDIILRDAKVDTVNDKGDQYEISCPFHEDYMPSCRLNKVTGVYHCFACGRKGTYTRFMWELQGKLGTYSQFCEQVLKAHSAMQSELGFTSLFVDSKTLDSAFQKRRVFSRESASIEMSLTSLVKEVRKIDDTWENLVLSLSLLQDEVPPSGIVAILKKNQIVIKKVPERMNLLNLLGSEKE